MSNEQVLKASNVSVAYDDAEARIEALDQISLSLCRGELVCVLGPSGCGKTTLILVFGGLIYPSHGEVLLDGQAIKAPSKQVGIIFQQSTLFPWLTVRGNVEFALKVRGLD
jgi:ABC-type taurine transport system ATPase subunit